MKKSALILFILLSFIIVNAQDVIRVACIGNSITYGVGIEDRENQSYPAVLGNMLGDKWEVINFGVSGSTLLSKGDYPYVNEVEYFEAMAFQPNIVIIMLGTNDSKPQNWRFKEDYISDYINLIQSFGFSNTNPDIYLCKLVPAFKLEWGINPDIISNEINPAIETVAKITGSKVIDLYTPFINDKSLFPDNIHLNEKGAVKMAEILYREIIPF